MALGRGTTGRDDDWLTLTASPRGRLTRCPSPSHLLTVSRRSTCFEVSPCSAS